MKVKFNKFERVAGLFVLTALLAFVTASLTVAIKKGWFSSKIRYVSNLASAEGLYAGTLVHVAGLRAGAVDEIELLKADQVKVHYHVLEKYAANVRKDSTLKVIRPFIIGEKVLEISVGSESSAILAAGSLIPAEETFDIMEVLSGRKMGSLVGSLQQLTSNMKVLVEAFADPQRTRALVNMFDRLDPLLVNLSMMTSDMTKITGSLRKDNRAEKLVTALVSITEEIDKILPLMNSQNPDLGIQLGQMLGNLNHLTAEMQKLTPAIAAIAPQLPQTTLRAVEALDETVVLLKAMQKSFLLRGNVDEVREEESKRQPASAK